MIRELGVAFAIAVLSLQQDPPKQMPESSQSQPGDSRLAGVLKRLEFFKGLETQLFGGGVLSSTELEQEFGLPPYDADRITRQLRYDVQSLEDKWLEINQQKVESIERARARLVIEKESPASKPHGPQPHPLFDVDKVRLALVYLRKKDYKKVIETLESTPGADARYLEGRAYDAMDMVLEAEQSYKRAATEAANDPRLLATTKRAGKGVEWRMQFGRPEDLTMALHRSPVQDVIQAALESAKTVSSRPADGAHTEGGTR
jgi:hypothetical protein